MRASILKRDRIPVQIQNKTLYIYEDTVIVHEPICAHGLCMLKIPCEYVSQFTNTCMAEISLAVQTLVSSILTTTRL
jgi:hypothetical protein